MYCIYNIRRPIRGHPAASKSQCRCLRISEPACRYSHTATLKSSHIVCRNQWGAARNPKANPITR